MYASGKIKILCHLDFFVLTQVMLFPFYAMDLDEKEDYGNNRFFSIRLIRLSICGIPLIVLGFGDCR